MSSFVPVSGVVVVGSSESNLVIFAIFAIISFFFTMFCLMVLLIGGYMYVKINNTHTPAVEKTNANQECYISYGPILKNILEVANNILSILKDFLARHNENSINDLANGLCADCKFINEDTKQLQHNINKDTKTNVCSNKELRMHASNIRLKTERITNIVEENKRLREKTIEAVNSFKLLTAPFDDLKEVTELFLENVDYKEEVSTDSFSQNKCKNKDVAPEKDKEIIINPSPIVDFEFL